MMKKRRSRFLSYHLVFSILVLSSHCIFLANSAGITDTRPASSIMWRFASVKGGYGSGFHVASLSPIRFVRQRSLIQIGRRQHVAGASLRDRFHNVAVSAFTFVELLVVIGIIRDLADLHLLPTLARGREGRAANSVPEQHATACGYHAARLYAVQYNDVLPIRLYGSRRPPSRYPKSIQLCCEVQGQLASAVSRRKWVWP